jgi:hypothetical protein
MQKEVTHHDGGLLFDEYLLEGRGVDWVCDDVHLRPPAAEEALERATNGDFVLNDQHAMHDKAPEDSRTQMQAD